MDRLAHLNHSLDRLSEQLAGSENALITAEAAEKVRLRQKIEDLKAEIAEFEQEKAKLLTPQDNSNPTPSTLPPHFSSYNPATFAGRSQALAVVFSAFAAIMLYLFLFGGIRDQNVPQEPPIESNTLPEPSIESDLVTPNKTPELPQTPVSPDSEISPFNILKMILFVDPDEGAYPNDAEECGDECDIDPLFYNEKSQFNLDILVRNNTDDFIDLTNIHIEFTNKEIMQEDLAPNEYNAISAKYKVVMSPEQISVETNHSDTIIVYPHTMGYSGYTDIELWQSIPPNSTDRFQLYLSSFSGQIAPRSHDIAIISLVATMNNEKYIEESQVKVDWEAMLRPQVCLRQSGECLQGSGQL